MPKLYATKNDLSEQTRSSDRAVNARLADSVDLQTQVSRPTGT